MHFWWRMMGQWGDPSMIDNTKTTHHDFELRWTQRKCFYKVYHTSDRKSQSLYCWLLLEKLLIVDTEVVDDEGENGRCWSKLFCDETVWWRPRSLINSMASWASRFSVRILRKKKIQNYWKSWTCQRFSHLTFPTSHAKCRWNLARNLVQRCR